MLNILWIKMFRINRTANGIHHYGTKHSPCSSDHHKAPYEVPDYRIYDSIENCPKLIELRDALAKKGLCDPWIRNEVWRFDKNNFGTQRKRFFKLFRGFKYGLVLAILTTIVTKYLEHKEHHDIDYENYLKSNENECPPRKRD